MRCPSLPCDWDQVVEVRGWLFSFPFFSVFLKSDSSRTLYTKERQRQVEDMVGTGPRKRRRRRRQLVRKWEGPLEWVTRRLTLR